MSLEPQKGWDFEGGKNLITNRTKYGVGWTSMSCVKKSHSDYGSHFVLVREGVFKDGKDHKLRKDDQQLLRKEAA